MDGGRRSEVTDPLYVVARSALLDALEAIGEQRDASSSSAHRRLISIQATPRSRFRHSRLTATWRSTLHD
jgi:hypothetical protein